VPNFDRHLYRGTAEAYDRFRLSYPPVLIHDLLGRVRPSRQGRLLDLACGTGQLAFALRDSFAEVWAVDQEADMIRLVAAKAARGGHPIRAVASSAEDLSAAEASFELITIGNAFHRLRRHHVARRTFGWLRPSGHLALCWSSSPWTGPAGWQRTMNEVLHRWQAGLAVRDRVPAGWDQDRHEQPDLAVLVAAGFEAVGRYEFSVEHRWTVDELAGFVYSTSFLAAPVFGDRAPEFAADLAKHLGPHGALVDHVGFAYELVRKPPDRDAGLDNNS
jgi:SAM-dependent methyltransferase